MRVLYFICIVGILAIASSCSYKQNHLLFQNSNIPADTTVYNKPAAIGRYRIQPQDVIQIRNLQNIKFIVDELPSNTGNSASGTTSQGQTYQVDEDGSIALPDLGHVPIAGLTRAEATKKVEGLYHKVLLKDPIIELKVLNLKVTVLGETNGQGNFALLKDNTTLVEMLGQAGGLTRNADERTVKIIRGTGLNQEVKQIDLSNISAISDPNAILQNGDIIYVAQNKRAIRDDKITGVTSLIQPALLFLNTALLIYSLAR